MGFARSFRRQMKRRKESAAKKRRKVVLEPLEPRILLSSETLSFSAAAGAALDLTLKLDDPTQELQLIDNASQSVVHRQAFANTGAVVITGGDRADNFTVDFNTPFSVANGILFTDAFDGDNDDLRVAGKSNVWHLVDGKRGNVDNAGFLDFFGIENLTGGAEVDTFVIEAGGSVDGVIDGGQGADSLEGADTDNTWEITALDAGALNDQVFESIENMIGGEDQDTFVLAEGAGIAGLIDGGNGSNTLDYSAYTSDVIVNLSDDTATGTNEISNIQNLAGGAGNDTLVGPDTDATWNIEGLNAGHVAGIDFSGFENLSGGAGEDTFIFGDGSGITGVIDGGGGLNTLDYSDYTSDVNADLAAGTATGTGGISNIQNVTGGAGSDTLAGNDAANVLMGAAGDDILTGGAGADTLDGGENVDTLKESRDADFTLADSALTIGSEGNDIISGIENAELTGGVSANVMDASAFTGNAVLAGEEGDDIFLAGPGAITYIGGGGNDTLQGEDQSNIWDIIGLDVGLLNGSIFEEIENLIGGAVADSFILAAGALVSGLIDGRQGSDRLTGGNTPNIWNITGKNAGKLNNKFFNDIENLTGGEEDDVFIFEGGSVSSVDGGAGSNTLDYSADTAGVVVDLATGTATYAGSIVDIENVVSGAGDDTIIGALSAVILDTGAGVDTLDFSNIASDLTATLHSDGTVSVTDGVNTVANIAGAENILGSGGNATVVFEDGAALAGTISGFAAVTLNYSAYTLDVSVNLATGEATGTGGVSNVVNIVGGSGSDTLIGPEVDATWNVTGPGSGSVAGVSFSNIENLTGSAGPDGFVFADGADVAGTVDGGAGVDTVDYSNYSTGLSVKMGSEGIANIENVIGTRHVDTLIGPSSDVTWLVTGQDEGSVGGSAFKDFENLTGSADNEDTFIIESGGSISGTIDGGVAGFDSLVISGGTYARVTITYTGPKSGAVDLNGNTIYFQGLEPVLLDVNPALDILEFNVTTGVDELELEDDDTPNDNKSRLDSLNATFEDTTFTTPASSLIINLQGGADTLTIKSLDEQFDADLTVNAGGGDDDITLNAKTGAGTYTINGEGDTDTIRATRDANMSLTNTQITVEADDFGLSLIETAVLSGGSGVNTFTVDGWTGSGILTGASSNDIVEATKDEDFTLTDTSLTASDGMSLTLSSDIEVANLTGGAGANTFTVSGWTGSGTLSDAGSNDIVAATKNENFTLTDGSLSATDGMNLNLSSIQVANLTGGAAVNTFTVSDWSNTANINGQAGNDTYKMGSGGGATDNFGTVYITDDGGDGTADKLDFTGHDNTLTVSSDRTAFTSSDGSSTLNQVGAELAEEIDYTVVDASGSTDFVNNQFNALLSEIETFIGKLESAESGAGALAAISNQLPFLAPIFDGTDSVERGIADVVDLLGAFQSLVTDAQSAINGLAGAEIKLSDIVGALDGLAISAPVDSPINSLSLTAATSYRGEDHDVVGGVDDRLELLIDLNFLATITDFSVDVALGEEATNLGIDLTANFSIDALLAADFQIGITTGPTPTAFLASGGTITLGLDDSGPNEAATANLAGPLNVGFLAVTLSGDLVLDARAIATLQDNDVQDARVDLGILDNDVNSAVSLAFSDSEGGSNYLTSTITATVDAGVEVGGIDLNGYDTVQLDFSLAGDPFGDQNGSVTPDIAFFADLDGNLADTSDQIDLLNFGNISPNEVMGMLGGVLDTLIALGTSEFMQVVIPYTGKTVGEILDYGKSFKEDVLDPLFQSGDVLQPDVNLDGFISLPQNVADFPEDGGLPDLKIGSIQELVNAFIDFLEIPGLKANFDSGELTFTIEFFRAFGLGDGDVTTKTNGAPGAEIQVLKYDATSAAVSGEDQDIVQAFRLAFRDGSDDLQVTGVIDAAVDETTPRNANDVANDIDTELTALLGAPVTVTPVPSRPGEFEILFDVSLGNVPQLGFAGEFLLNFGAGLGDFLNFETDGSFGMAGVLDTTLTFGIDLNPDTAVKVLPPVFSPNIVSVTEKRAGGSSDEEVQIQVVEPVGGSFELAFRATEGEGLFTLINPVTVQADLTQLQTDLQTELDAIPALFGNATVSVPDSSNPRTLLVTFGNTLADTDVELITARDAGILSGPAQFDLSLSTEADPAIAIEGGIVQFVDIRNATGGDFVLSFDGDPTIAIPFGETAAFVETQLKLLPSVISSGLDVSVMQDGDDYRIAFFQLDPTNVTKEAGDHAETTIAVNPTDPDNIVIGVIDDSDDDFVYWTKDGGTTWTKVQIEEPAGAPSDGSGPRSHGDPAIVFSRDGTRVVFVHMVDKDAAAHDADNNDHIHVMASAASLDGGETWNQADTGVLGSFSPDEDGDGADDDNNKEFIAVGPDADDPTRDRFAVAWQRANVIFVSTSLDGINWTTPHRVGNAHEADSDNSNQHLGDSIDSIPTFGPNGEIYVVWEDFSETGVGKIMFDVSLDGGRTWDVGADKESVDILNTFPGLNTATVTSNFEPPDTHIAVGPDFIVEVVNDAIAIIDKDDGTQISVQLLSDFFSALPLSGGAIFDPVVTYDALAERFVVAALDGKTIGNNLLYAVSNTDDPTDGFTEMHRIQVDLFEFFFDIVELSTDDFTLVPVIHHDAVTGDSMWFVTSDGVGNPDDQIRLLQLGGLDDIEFGMPMFGPEFAITVDQFLQPPDATQPTPSLPIETNDHRMLDAELRDGRLVATHTIGADDRAAVRWYEFAVGLGLPILTQQGTLDHNRFAHTYYPSIAIAPSGDIGLTFMQSFENEFVSMYVTGQKVGDEPGTMRDPVRVAEGTQVYHAIYVAESSGTAQGGAAISITLANADSNVNDIYNGLFVTITAGPGIGEIFRITDYDGASRVATIDGTWLTNPVGGSSDYEIFEGPRGGDYSAVVIDPETNTFWAANEFVELKSTDVGTGNWSTHIVQFVVPEHVQIYFDTALYNLDKADKDILDAFAARLKVDPTLVVTIEGHTDTVGAVGTPANTDNQLLSNRRAQAVFDYLTGAKHNISPDRLTAVGFSELQLPVRTANAVESEANRTVVLTVDRLAYTGSVNAFNDTGTDVDYVIPAQPDRGIWMGLSTDVDLSGGPNDGRIYVAFADQAYLNGVPAGNHDDTDIFVIASDDRGATWTALGGSPDAFVASGAALVKVSDDTGTASQFFSWLDVDPTTGNLAVSWYDARKDLGVVGPESSDGIENNEVHYFTTISFDSGETWLENQQVSDGFSRAVGGTDFDFGDYTALAFFDGTAHMAWADNSNSTATIAPIPPNPAGAHSLNDAYYGTIGLEDVSGRLTANADGLDNSAGFGPLTINVARDINNTSLDDLAADVQREIDQELFNQHLTIGFNPMDEAFGGTHTTGVINPGSGSAYLADEAPYTALGGALPTDLAVTVVLPLSYSVTPVEDGDGPGGNEETQIVFIDAGSGTFTLSLGGQTTTALPYNASAAQIEAALEDPAFVGVDAVTVTQSDTDTDGDGVKEYTSTVVFTTPDTNLATMTIDGSELVEKSYQGRLRLARVADNGIADELEAVVNKLLDDTAVTIAVTEPGGQLRIESAGGPVEIRVDSPIKASAGGGRISLDAPLAKQTFDALQPAIEVARRLEISVDYNDPAFQEMAIASSPTSFDGRLGTGPDQNIQLTLKVDGTDVDVTLAAADTSSNTNLDQLVAQLQQAVHDGLVAESLAIALDPLTDDIIQVKRVSVDENEPDSPKGNRILFEGEAGTVTELSVFVPNTPNNGAITELGFAAGQSETKRSKASTFFLEDVSFGGNFGLFEDNISATASLGMLGVTADLEATVDAPSGKFFGADVDFDLINPVDGTSRVTIDDLLDAINAGKFLYDVNDQGSSIVDGEEIPDTGFIDGVVAGGLGFNLVLAPDGAIAGLPLNLGSMSISAQSPNWLLSPPSFGNPFMFPKLDQSLADPGVTISTIGLAGSGILNEDMLFVISQTIGGNTFATPIVVTTADTAGNITVADLEADIQAAVDKGIARIQHLVDKVEPPVVATAATIDVAVTGSNVTFETLAGNDASAVNLRGLFVDLDFTALTGLDELLDSLKNLSFDDIIAVLRLLVDMLQSLDGSDDGSPLAGVFGLELPVIDRSIGDLVDLSGDFLDFVDELAANPTGSLQLLETKLRSLLGLPAGPSILSFDPAPRPRGRSTWTWPRRTWVSSASWSALARPATSVSRPTSISH
jgi:outer membrane protein OmpA-like peptidoglycan-associated protein/Ca2+-binding RTX toxin-like protein